MNLAKRMVQRARRRIDVMRGRDVDVALDKQLPNERFGSDYGGFYVHAPAVDASSVVYSFGVGEDVSFDLAMIERFGVTVHAFDPTPKSIAWVRAQKLPSKFVLHEVGIAGYDGTASFAPPENPNHVSHTLLARESTKDRAITVQVKRLSTLLRELGHDRIDVLKMDVEGAEYDVFDDILGAGIAIRQILVEFHHRFPNVGVQQTVNATAKLRRAGYDLFAVSDNGEEYSFLKR